jgi:hypothetical protein
MFATVDSAKGWQDDCAQDTTMAVRVVLATAQ